MFENCSGNRIETHAIRDPSLLYFSDNCNAIAFKSANTSFSALLGELAWYRSTFG